MEPWVWDAIRGMWELMFCMVVAFGVPALLIGIVVAVVRYFSGDRS